MVQRLCRESVRLKGLGNAVVCCEFIYSRLAVSGISSSELVYCKNLSSVYFLRLALHPHVPLLVFCNCAPSGEPSQQIGFFVSRQHVGLGDGVRESVESLHFTIIDLKSLGENREEVGLPDGQTFPMRVNGDMLQWSAHRPPSPPFSLGL